MEMTKNKVQLATALYRDKKDKSSVIHIREYKRVTMKDHIFCRFCEYPLIGRQGESKKIQWHFAHKTGSECVTTNDGKASRRMCAWHRSYQEACDAQAIERPIIKDKTLMRADIYNEKTGLVIELQHSSIQETTVHNRENFYKNLLWLVDGTRLGEDCFLHNVGNKCFIIQPEISWLKYLNKDTILDTQFGYFQLTRLGGGYYLAKMLDLEVILSIFDEVLVKEFPHMKKKDFSDEKISRIQYNGNYCVFLCTDKWYLKDMFDEMGYTYDDEKKLWYESGVDITDIEIGRGKEFCNRLIQDPYQINNLVENYEIEHSENQDEKEPPIITKKTFSTWCATIDVLEEEVKDVVSEATIINSEAKEIQADLNNLVDLRHHDLKETIEYLEVDFSEIQRELSDIKNTLRKEISQQFFKVRVFTPSDEDSSTILARKLEKGEVEWTPDVFSVVEKYDSLRKIELLTKREIINNWYFPPESFISKHFRIEVPLSIEWVEPLDEKNVFGFDVICIPQDLSHWIKMFGFSQFCRFVFETRVSIVGAVTRVSAKILLLDKEDGVLCQYASKSLKLNAEAMLDSDILVERLEEFQTEWKGIMLGILNGMRGTKFPFLLQKFSFATQ